MRTVDILRAAREKIARPEHWTKGMYARATDGEYAAPRSPRAVCWCALGAAATHAEVLAAFDKAIHDLS